MTGGWRKILREGSSLTKFSENSEFNVTYSDLSHKIIIVLRLSKSQIQRRYDRVIFGYVPLPNTPGVLEIFLGYVTVWNIPWEFYSSIHDLATLHVLDRCQFATVLH